YLAAFDRGGRLVHAQCRRLEFAGILQRPGWSRRRGRGRLERAGRADRNAGRFRYHGREIPINVDEDLVHRAGAHAFVDDLVELEGEGAGDMVLLPLAHAVPKLRGLTEMVSEAGTPLAHLWPCLLPHRHRAEGR